MHLNFGITSSSLRSKSARRTNEFRRTSCVKTEDLETRSKKEAKERRRRREQFPIMLKHRGETHIIAPSRLLFSVLSSWGQEVMSRRRGHRNILVALISKCMSASVQVLQIEAPAALFLSLENHRLQSDASSSSSTSSRSSSFRPWRGRSRERRGSDTGHNLSLPLCVFGQEAIKWRSRGEPPVPPWQIIEGRG